MASWSSHLDRCLDKALAAYLKLQAGNQEQPLPIDPKILARGIGNIDLEEREMIPEAAVKLSGSRFQIYLQSNFKDHPGMRIRQRFSLAHEIAHTFFFEVYDGGLKPMRGGPRGMNLESACHEGASRLLVPKRFLRKELEHESRAICGEDVLRLTETFDVSL